MTPEEINKKILQLLKQSDSESQLLVANYEKTLLKLYRKALKEIHSKLAAIYAKYGDDVEYADLVTFNRLKNLEASITSEVKKLTINSIKSIEVQLKEFYSESFYRSAYSIESGLGIKLGFGELNKTVIEASLKNKMLKITWQGRLKDHAQKYIRQIRTDLTRGLIQGEGYAKIANAITDKTKIQASKVLRIVRTEAHRVQNIGRIASFDKSESAAKRLGIVSGRVWIHSGNPREPREDHIRMNDVEADDKGIFTLPDGTTTEGPGLSGVAEHDIHCGCTTGLKFKNLKSASFEDYLKRNYNQSYDDWKKELLSE